MMNTESNMPVLWQNALLQYRTEVARKAWVWYAETRGSGMQYKGDKFAGEVDKLVLTNMHFIPLGMAQHKSNPYCDTSEEVMSDLMSYILRRHANWRLGGNIKPTYC